MYFLEVSIVHYFSILEKKKSRKIISIMTLMSFFGCALIAFGPALSMFILTVVPDAQQVIVLISR